MVAKLVPLPLLVPETSRGQRVMDLRRGYRWVRGPEIGLGWSAARFQSPITR